ncbi:hypothetical protein FHT79_001210 [Rhizobium sp. BK212]|nr:hypothetical protein [Rhizobium sp. BK212]
MTRPTKPIEPTMLTTLAVIAAVKANSTIWTRRTAMPREAAASVPNAKASSARTWAMQTMKPASAIGTER